MPKQNQQTRKESADLPWISREVPLAISSPSSPVPLGTVQPSEVIGGLEAVADGEAMANFPVNPLAFLPEGMIIEQGPADRKVRSVLVVPPVPPLHNDRVIIAETNR